jgi:hypothetical protein
MSHVELGSYEPRRLKAPESFTARVYRAHRAHPRWRQLSVWARQLATDLIFEGLTPQNNGALCLGPQQLEGWGFKSKWRSQALIGELIASGFLKAGLAVRGRATRYALALLPICQNFADLLGRRTSPPVGEVGAKSSPPVGEVVDNSIARESTTYPKSGRSPYIGKSFARARVRSESGKDPEPFLAGPRLWASLTSSTSGALRRYRERQRLMRCASQEEALYA